MLVSSTTFLIGPTEQLKTMFKENRVTATVAYLVSVFLALFSGLYVCYCVGSIVLTVNLSFLVAKKLLPFHYCHWSAVRSLCLVRTQVWFLAYVLVADGLIL